MKDEIIMCLAPQLLILVGGLMYANRPQGPDISVQEDKIIVYQGGLRGQHQGTDLDKDGILDKCTYADGIRGGRVFRFDCDLSDLPHLLPKKQMGEMFGRLQIEYDNYFIQQDDSNEREF